MKKIIYPLEDGKIAVIHPVPDNKLPLEELARKDVPPGVPFLIVKTTSLPHDRTFRDAWEADFTSPHGHGIGHEAWTAEQAEKKGVKS